MSQKNKYILSIIFVFILVGASIYGLMAKGLGLGLDLNGGLSVVLTAKETSKTRVNERTMKQALFIMRNRVDKLGVSEPSIERHGKKNIIVQLPGIKDPKKALDIIGQTALLEFAIVKDEHNSKSVAELNKMLEKGEKPLGKALMRGDAISNASGGFAQSQQNSLGNQYEVTMNFTSKGAQAFGDITSKNVNKSLAIILDNKIMTAPNIQTAITDGNAVIEGMESLEEAKRVALVLQTGQLPFELEVSQQQQVGPTLGQDSLNAALMAAIIGFALVALYMIAYYRVLGLIAWLSLGAFASLLFGAMVLLDILLGAAGVAGISLSLPSIAGVILLIGIAADSSIIIFERIKEEVRSGKSLRSAFDAGFSHGFRTFLDADLVTFLTAAVLFYFGIGLVKGFALTLMVGIFIDIFVSLVFKRSILKLIAVNNWIKNPALIGLKGLKGAGSE